MTPYSLTSSNHNRDNALSQFVVIERYPRGVYARIVCPSIGQREAPIIAGEISDAIANAAMPRGGALVLDLSNVVMVTSIGLGTCVDIRRQAEGARLKPYLFGTNRQLLDILRMMKIDRQYTIVHGKDELGAILG
jgi:anti-anti-sigma regulatory factor